MNPRVREVEEGGNTRMDLQAPLLDTVSVADSWVACAALLLRLPRVSSSQQDLERALHPACQLAASLTGDLHACVSDLQLMADNRMNAGIEGMDAPLQRHGVHAQGTPTSCCPLPRCY